MPGSATTSASLVGSVANAFTVGLLALFLTFFLLQDGEKGWGRAIQVTDGLASRTDR